MKRSYLFFLSIPSILLLIASAAAFYWSHKFHLLHIEAINDRLPKAEAKLRAVQCDAVDKEVVLALLKKSVESSKDMSEILFAVGKLAAILAFVGALVLYGVRKHVMLGEAANERPL